jgi:hypothetical protein
MMIFLKWILQKKFVTITKKVVIFFCYILSLFETFENEKKKIDTLI